MPNASPLVAVIVTSAPKATVMSSGSYVRSVITMSKATGSTGLASVVGGAMVDVVVEDVVELVVLEAVVDDSDAGSELPEQLAAIKATDARAANNTVRVIKDSFPRTESTPTHRATGHQAI